MDNRFDVYLHDTPSKHSDLSLEPVVIPADINVRWREHAMRQLSRASVAA